VCSRPEDFFPGLWDCWIWWSAFVFLVIMSELKHEMCNSYIHRLGFLHITCALCFTMIRGSIYSFTKQIYRDPFIIFKISCCVKAVVPSFDITRNYQLHVIKTCTIVKNMIRREWRFVINHNHHLKMIITMHHLDK
jgi:hypothetical protein